MEPEIFIHDHWHFLVALAYYFVPALVGSTLTTYVKSISDDDKASKRSGIRAGFIMFFSALVPAFIMASAHGYIMETIKLSSFRIGTAFLFGCVGDETLHIITSLKAMMSVMKVLSNYIENLKHITQVSDNVVQELEKEAQKEKDAHETSAAVEDDTHSESTESPKPDSEKNTQSYHNKFDDDSDNDYYVE